MQITHLLITQRLVSSQPCGICILMKKNGKCTNKPESTQKISCNDNYHAHHIPENCFLNLEKIFYFQYL